MLDSTDSIFNAVKLMHEKKTGSVLVNGPRGEPIGIFTERDLLTKVLSKQARLEGQVVDYCTSPMISAKLKGIDAKKAAKTMRANGIKRLPLTEDGKVVAIVTARDLVESFLLYEEQKERKPEHRKT
jgi:CBS domain-containing protein